jgi:hypothetical protein
MVRPNSNGYLLLFLADSELEKSAKLSGGGYEKARWRCAFWQLKISDFRGLNVADGIVR